MLILTPFPFLLTASIFLWPTQQDQSLVEVSTGEKKKNIQVSILYESAGVFSHAKQLLLVEYNKWGDVSFTAEHRGGGISYGEEDQVVFCRSLCCFFQTMGSLSYRPIPTDRPFGPCQTPYRHGTRGRYADKTIASRRVLFPHLNSPRRQVCSIRRYTPYLRLWEFQTGLRSVNGPGLERTRAMLPHRRFSPDSSKVVTTDDANSQDP